MRLRVRFLMVNATGQATTLRRTVTVVLQQEREAARPVGFAALRVLVTSARGAVLHFALDRAADRITARIAGAPARIHSIGGSGSGVYGASVHDKDLRPGRSCRITVRAVSRLGGATDRSERLFLRRRWPRVDER